MIEEFSVRMQKILLGDMIQEIDNQAAQEDDMLIMSSKSKNPQAPEDAKISLLNVPQPFKCPHDSLSRTPCTSSASALLALSLACCPLKRPPPVQPL